MNGFVTARRSGQRSRFTHHFFDSFHRQLTVFLYLHFDWFLGFYQVSQLVHEFFDIFEIQVDRGETDIGYLVVAPQAIHDELTEFAGLALALLRLDDEGFGFIDDLLEFADGDGPLLAGAQQAVENFLAVELFAAAVFLDHHVRDFVDTLVGGKPLAALQAFAASADGFRLLALAGVDYLIFSKSAKRTFHGAARRKTKISVSE